MADDRILCCSTAAGPRIHRAHPSPFWQLVSRQTGSGVAAQPPSATVVTLNERVAVDALCTSDERPVQFEALVALQHSSLCDRHVRTAPHLARLPQTATAPKLEHIQAMHALAALWRRTSLAGSAPSPFQTARTSVALSGCCSQLCGIGPRLHLGGEPLAQGRNVNQRSTPTASPARFFHPSCSQVGHYAALDPLGLGAVLLGSCTRVACRVFIEIAEPLFFRQVSRSAPHAPFAAAAALDPVAHVSEERHRTWGGPVSVHTLTRRCE
eukprot:5561998-Prymnesium_polylepis.1